MLSISKLEKMLLDAGFIPKAYFTIHDMCVFVEIVSLRSGDILMLYISSKYEFEVDKSTGGVYKIKYVDMNDNESNIESGLDYEPDEQYPAIDVGSPDLAKEKNVAEHLEENYRRCITIRSIDDRDRETLKNCYRQLKRLKHCVLNVKYKVALVFKNYICNIGRDDDISCFTIKDFERTKNEPAGGRRQVVVSIGLELLYDRITTINSDATLVKENIYQILIKNQAVHVKNLRKMANEMAMLAQNPAVDSTVALINLDVNIARFEELLQRTTKAGDLKRAQLDEIERAYNLKTGFQHDIEKSHAKKKPEDELQTISALEKEILVTLLALKEDKGNLLLTIDKVMFDASVLSNIISKSFEALLK